MANSLKTPGSISGPAPCEPYPRQLRRVLHRFESPSIKIDEVQYAAGLCLPRHSDDSACLTFAVEGLYWSAHGRGGRACIPGTMRFLPAGEPHQNYFPVRSKCLLLELRLPILEEARDRGALLRTPGELVSPSAARLGKRLYREFRRKDDLSEFALEDLLLRLLTGDGCERMFRRSPLPPWLGQIRELLHEQGAGRLTLADLAGVAGRHPVQVCRQFHRRFGLTISAYVRQLRVARAQSLLLRPDLSVADIALACGFSDQSHFTTAFRRITGMPPRRYRQQNASAMAQA